jgi:hypothetical protein
MISVTNSALRCQVDITAGAASAWTNVDDNPGIRSFLDRPSPQRAAEIRSRIEAVPPFVI